MLNSFFLFQRTIGLSPLCVSPVLYYSLLARRDHIFNLGSTATRTPIVNKTTFENIEILVPTTLEEQCVVAHVLGTLDDKIELNRRMNATLEQMAQALFKSWFVDFDPVKAKAEGSAPEGMDEETAALFPSEFEESEMGLIPKGWKVSTIGDEVQVLGGGTPSTKEPSYWESGIHHWVTPKDLSQLSHKMLLDTERSITDAGLQQIRQHRRII